MRSDLIRRELSYVPSSIAVTRGGTQQRDFCSLPAAPASYPRSVDASLAMIERLPARHPYVLDDRLFGNRRVAEAMFDGMEGMGDSTEVRQPWHVVLRGNLVEHVAPARPGSLAIGSDTFDAGTLAGCSKSRTLRETAPR
ncbi:hypothetical protein [Acuticoccus sp.]|uniref:hypothetical protein n=1 Tax=Acuticoccus sp. TaxID=1904378 RepID=UPI003B5270B3